MEYVETVKSSLLKALPKNEKELEWWIKFRKPEDILKKHASFLYCELAFYIVGFLTLCHAWRSGGRFRWLWFATIAHGITVECVSYFVPDIDNFWHAQSMVMLVGQRLPLHIILVYPVFIYTASVAVSHMNLRWWAEPFAVGLSVVLLDIPFDIMGVKLLWWTWHDDDPNIFDRHYWVPWTSYYFHAAFASAFTILFFGLRSLMCRSGLKYQSLGFFCELPILVLTGLFSMPLGILQFVPIYNPLHDRLGIHTEVCLLLLLAAYALIVWSADRYPYDSARSNTSSCLSAVVLGVLFHYATYVYLVLTEKPETARATGYHQPVGKCGVSVPVKSALGDVLKKTKNLCVKSYHEDYFDFQCIKKMPANGTEWYTICGTKYDNYQEYVLVVCAFCAVGLFWFWQALCRSGPQPKTKALRVKQHRD